MSLRDQLLKAGLVNKKQVKRTEAAKRKQAHREHKGKQDALVARAETEDELERIEQDKRAKREEDRQLNLELEAKRRAHENHFRCRQLVRSRALNERDAHEPYYFLQDACVVRRIYLTPMQVELMARGRAALVVDPDDADTFLIVGEKTVKTVAELCPEMIVCQHSQIANDHELSNFENDESERSSDARPQE